MEPVCHETKFIATAGASTTRKTAGAAPRLPEGLIIRIICVEMAPGNPPVRVGIHVIVGGKPVELKAGWVRGGHHGFLIWEGRFPIPKSTDFFFAARNDTGADRTLTAHWVTEREMPNV